MGRCINSVFIYYLFFKNVKLFYIGYNYYFPLKHLTQVRSFWNKVVMNYWIAYHQSSDEYLLMNIHNFMKYLTFLFKFNCKIIINFRWITNSLPSAVWRINQEYNTWCICCNGKTKYYKANLTNVHLMRRYVSNFLL